jgi:hypothetical protein
VYSRLPLVEAGTSRPSRRIWPEVGEASLASIRASVDLPEPLSPTTAVMPSAGSASDTCSTARTASRLPRRDRRVPCTW